MYWPEIIYHKSLGLWDVPFKWSQIEVQHVLEIYLKITLTKFMENEFVLFVLLQKKCLKRITWDFGVSNFVLCCYHQKCVRRFLEYMPNCYKENHNFSFSKYFITPQIWGNFFIKSVVLFQWDNWNCGKLIVENSVLVVKRKCNELYMLSKKCLQQGFVDIRKCYSQLNKF